MLMHFLLLSVENLNFLECPGGPCIAAQLFGLTYRSVQTRVLYKVQACSGRPCSKQQSNSMRTGGLAAN